MPRLGKGQSETSNGVRTHTRVRVRRQADTHRELALDPLHGRGHDERHALRDVPLEGLGLEQVAAAGLGARRALVVQAAP